MPRATPRAMKGPMMIIVPEDTVLLSLDERTHKIHINCDWRNSPLIPKGYDIVKTTFGIRFDSEEVAAIYYEIGGQKTATFDKLTMPDLESFPIYLTQCTHHVVNMVIEYDKGWLATQKYTDVVEYVERETFGDEILVYVEAEDQYMRGKPVEQFTVPITVRRIRVTIPEITFHLACVEDPPDRVPFRHMITIDEADHTWVDQLKKTRDLKMVDEHTGYVTNWLRYASGMAGVIYAN